MGKFLKKNWFVVLAVLIFTGISTYYIYDTNKGKLKGKEVNGEDVVFTVNDEDTTASGLYDEMYKQRGASTVVALFKQAVADASVKTTSEMKETAEANADTIRSNYESYYGTSYESYLESDLLSTGYSDLVEYLVEAQKLQQVSADYAKANFDDLQIRQISYILIKFEDSENITDEPTADEQARMDAVDAKLASADFATAAADHSEDTSTSSDGGNLGIIDKNASSLDSAFLEASLALQEGEVSDWVRSESFGYFKIYCTAATAETLEANNDDPYLELVQNYDSSLENLAVWAKASELGVDFNGNDEIETLVKEQLGVTEE